MCALHAYYVCGCSRVDWSIHTFLSSEAVCVVIFLVGEFVRHSIEAN